MSSSLGQWACATAEWKDAENSRVARLTKLGLLVAAHWSSSEAFARWLANLTGRTITGEPADGAGPRSRPNQRSALKPAAAVR
jgi:hypothetical protein